MSNSLLANGADGISDIEGKAVTGSGEQAETRASFNGAPGDASDIVGQAERLNGAFGKSDTEGKPARGSSERVGQGASFKRAGANESNFRGLDATPLPLLNREP